MECKFKYNFRVLDNDKVVVCKPDGTFVRKNFDDFPNSFIDAGTAFAERDNMNEKGVKAVVLPMDMDETLDFIDQFNKIRAEKGWPKFEFSYLTR